MSVKSVIPVLALNTDQLTRKEDQLAYLLRHAFYNPGWTSSQIEDSLVSIRRLLAKYENDPAEFANALRQSLEEAVKHLYADHTVNVDTKSLSSNAYSVIITILDQQGRVALTSDDIRVEDNQLYLAFENK